MEECLFCKIINGEIPAHKVFEDENNLAFLDAFPHAQGHTVVIPKKHAETIFDLDNDDSCKILVTVKRTMKILEDKLNPDGFNVGWNHNDAGGQVVKHLHIHILPRFKGDGGGSIHSIIKNPGDKSVDELAKMFK